MKIIAILPVRNEDWIIGLSLRALLLWVDAVCILDHASTDYTAAIIWQCQLEAPNRIVRLTEADPIWEEMRHRQSLLEAAREFGPTHIVTVDCDEVLTGNLLPYIRPWISTMPKGSVMQLPWLCLRNSIDLVHTTGTWGSQWASTAFVDEPAWHWAARDGYEHHHRHPMGKTFRPHKPVAERSGGLMHLQFVSDRRLRAKQALYKMQEVIRWPGRSTVAQINDQYDYAVYGEKGTRGKEQFGVLAAVPASWWTPYRTGLGEYMNLDAEPWQEAECKRLLSEHGIERFRGLDLFGLRQCFGLGL